MPCLAVLSGYSWGTRVSSGSFVTSWPNLSFLSLVSLLALHTAHVHFIHGPRLARETDISFITLETRVSPGSRGAWKAVVPFFTRQSWQARWSWRARLPRGPHDAHLSLGTWKPRKSGSPLLSRKPRKPRLPREARQPLSPFISFRAWHVQAWESGKAFLSFHSRRT